MKCTSTGSIWNYFIPSNAALVNVHLLSLQFVKHNLIHWHVVYCKHSHLWMLLINQLLICVVDSCALVLEVCSLSLKSLIYKGFDIIGPILNMTYMHQSIIQHSQTCSKTVSALFSKWKMNGRLITAPRALDM